MNDRSTPTPTRSVDRRTPGQWVFFIVAMIVGLVCIRLGIWQVDRLRQRRAHNAAIRAALALPPVNLPQDLDLGDDLKYRHAAAEGDVDPTQEIYLTNRSLDGIAGVHVVSPLRVSGTDAWLMVDRGWISDDDYRTKSPEAWSIEGSVRLTGILLPSQVEPVIPYLGDRIPAPGEPALREWRSLNLPGIGAQLPYPILDVYLLLDRSPSGAAVPTPDPQIDLSEGPHLSYAIQWFAFAAIAFVGGAAWFRRGRRSAA